MLSLPSHELKRLRQEYPKGTRVELVRMVDDPWTTLKPGSQGVVDSIDSTGSVHIVWNNGSTLAALYGIDEIRKLPAPAEVIRSQVIAIRDSGAANMYQVDLVQRLAFDAGYYELVNMITENPGGYAKFISTGNLDYLQTD